MTGIPLVVAEPTGMYRRQLRRFVFTRDSDCPGGYHNASAEIGEVPETEHEQVHGDRWPHDDPRWPAACEHCGYAFTDADEWQLNDNRVYRRPDGIEFASWAANEGVPPGTMWRIPWADAHLTAAHPQHVESWLVILPDGGTWITSQAATGGGYWAVTGTPPLIDVSPSIWHNQPAGWHGFIRNGELVPA